MKILLTGANGFIGARLLNELLLAGHEIVACSRAKENVHIPPKFADKVSVISRNFLQSFSLPKDIDVAFYLVHSMATKKGDFQNKDRLAAQNFVNAIKETHCQQIIYLTGLISSENLSKHLKSRLEVEEMLKTAPCCLTVFRAGIIIGSGSASFEIIRDLVEKLPVMIAPRWVNTKCQPIAIRDVLFYLVSSVNNTACFDKTFDIAGPDILSYKEMLLGFASLRKLKRYIFTVPFFSPRLSSHWLVFITSTNYYLARSLVDSMKTTAIKTEDSIAKVLPRKLLGFKEALTKALEKLENADVLSAWRDSFSASNIDPSNIYGLRAPSFGCYKMATSQAIFEQDPAEVFEKICRIGGKSGYFAMSWAWKFRGFIDRSLGGVGLNRGKTARKKLRPLDVIDFWRVAHVDYEKHILVLYAEMKMPGEAWLEFLIEDKKLIQVATFRPLGLLGRFYWWLLWPIHKVLFPRMLLNICGK